MRIRVCLSQQKTAQLVNVKPNCKPLDLMKLSASKLRVKLNATKKQQQQWKMFTADGSEIRTVEDVASLQTMDSVYLIRPGETFEGTTAMPDTRAEDGKGGTSTKSLNRPFPDEIWRLIWRFVSLQVEDYELLSLSAVSKQWSRVIPLKFLPVRSASEFTGIGKGYCLNYVGLGKWFWLTSSSKKQQWMPYGEETRLCLEDAFGKGAESAIVEIRETQEIGQKKGNKKPRKQLVNIDLTAMEQHNLSGKGRVFQIIRIPRVCFPSVSK